MTGIGRVSEAKLQRVFDSRLPGAFIHVYEVSKRAKRRGNRSRVAKLAITKEMVARRIEFQEALKSPQRKVKFPIGPYDLFIQLFREIKPTNNLKKENKKLAQELERLKALNRKLIKDQQEKETLLNHVLESDLRETDVKMKGPQMPSSRKRAPSPDMMKKKRRETMKKPQRRRKFREPTCNELQTANSRARMPSMSDWNNPKQEELKRFNAFFNNLEHQIMCKNIGGLNSREGNLKAIERT